MSADIEVKYQGDLYCDINYLPGDYQIKTSVKNNDFFSPVDLLAAALASCTVSNVAYSAEGRMPIDTKDISATVEKSVEDKPVPHVSALKVTVTIKNSGQLSDKDKMILEKSADTCKVRNSIYKQIDITSEIVFA
ncbi:MAG: OsmC family protein [Alphaproteobacteria bacterium]|nr:OsmC family protein [Alphaproteobacteria bacterium]